MFSSVTPLLSRFVYFNDSIHAINDLVILEIHVDIHGNPLDLLGAVCASSVRSQFTGLVPDTVHLSLGR